MTSRGASIYCWDSSVFLAWIKGEACHPLAEMEVVASEVTANRAMMLVPAQVYEEIELSRCTPEQRTKVQGFLTRTNVALAEQTPAVTRRAAEIMARSFEEAGFTTKIKDARIMASAIVFRASVLHSVDSDFLRLDKSPIVNGLSIVKPISLSGQRGLV